VLNLANFSVSDGVLRRKIKPSGKWRITVEAIFLTCIGTPQPFLYGHYCRFMEQKARDLPGLPGRPSNPGQPFMDNNNENQ